MKELIQELAIKSGFKKYKNDDGLYSPYIEGCDLNDEIEEFAELIVKECVNVMMVQRWSDGDEISEAVDLIEKHFGVK